MALTLAIVVKVQGSVNAVALLGFVSVYSLPVVPLAMTLPP